MPITADLNRQALVRRGQRLEYFTVAYNSAEGLVSIVAGLIAGSVSLVGFGLDSLIEVASGPVGRSGNGRRGSDFTCGLNRSRRLALKKTSFTLTCENMCGN